MSSTSKTCFGSVDIKVSFVCWSVISCASSTPSALPNICLWIAIWPKTLTSFWTLKVPVASRRSAMKAAASSRSDAAVQPASAPTMSSRTGRSHVCCFTVQPRAMPRGSTSVHQESGSRRKPRYESGFDRQISPAFCRAGTTASFSATSLCVR